MAYTIAAVDAMEVGDTAALTITVTPADGTTAATVTVTKPSGVVVTPTVTPGALASGARPFSASVTTDQAGTWVQTWVVSGTGALGPRSGLFVASATPRPSRPITTDTTTDLGRIRLIISDGDPTDPVFDDVELLAFLALEGGSVRGAAAMALDTIASNEAMVSKVIRTQDLQTDGAKLADALRKHADSLRRAAPSGTTAAGAAIGIRTTGYDPLGLTATRTPTPWLANVGEDYDYTDPTVRHLGLP